MKMIVGLGNPGSKYQSTKHNVGFEVLDLLSQRLDFNFNKNKFDALYGERFQAGEKHLFVKPQTYMNLSGQAVRPLSDYYGIADEDLLIVYDDLDLELGQLRFRFKGSAGGHNGMKDIIQKIGQQQIKRARLGIGRPAANQTVVQHVLSPFRPEDQADIRSACQQAVDGIEFWLAGHPFEEMMSKYSL